MRPPQPHDRVRVTFEGVYVRKADGDHHIVTADHDWSHETPNGAVLEVLESADDPSKDAVPATCRHRAARVQVWCWSTRPEPGSQSETAPFPWSRLNSAAGDAVGQFHEVIA
jgi:hypothetical protein